jgi:hypothetical protein
MHSKITASTVLVATLLAVSTTDSCAAESRRIWDQQEAERRVGAVLGQEAANDFAWDKIAWTNDPMQATREAAMQQKPILVYFFLKGQVGPAQAPC